MAATGCMNRLFGVVLVAVALMAHCSTAQTTHVVGGSTGWTVPSVPTSYSTWASQQTFRVGDSITFNFATSRHDVATVTKAAYDACDASSPIGPVQTTSPVTIRLTSPGPQYYFCSFQGHCSLGQKLAINVVAAPSPPPTPTTTPPPTTSATPPTTSTVPPPTTSSSPPPSVVATPPTTSASPPTTSTAPPPTAGGPSPSPASRLVAAGLSVTLFSFAVALLF